MVYRDQPPVQEAKTAILLFSRSLEEEFSAKSFGLTKERFRLLYKSLIRRTRKTLEGIDSPVFEFDSQQQVGNAFGERLINALEAVQKKGYNKIIVIGNDAPGLNREILKDALKRISRGKNVLGRDARGGCYLMGFDISQTDTNALLLVNWHSNLVFDQVNDLLAADTSLPQLADLNNREDFKSALLLKTSPKWYIISLLQLVFHGTISILTHVRFIQGIALTATQRRGPPALAVTIAP